MCQNKPFLFIWALYSYKEKNGSIIGSHPKPRSTFFGRNKTTNRKLSKAFYFIKVSYVEAEFIKLFLGK